MQPKWQHSELKQSLGSLDGCQLLRPLGQGYLPIPLTQVNGGQILCFPQMLNDIINSWIGYESNFEIAFRYLKSIQNLIVPSFLGTKTTGLHHSLFEG